MIAIKSDCVSNAHNMLTTQARNLGSIGDDTYYVLDGHAWRVTKVKGIYGWRHQDNYLISVARSEDVQETDNIVRMMREVNEREAEKKTWANIGQIGLKDQSDPMEFQN